MSCNIHDWHQLIRKCLSPISPSPHLPISPSPHLPVHPPPHPFPPPESTASPRPAPSALIPPATIDQPHQNPMSTELQIAANRRNAQSSTGPRTREGRAAVRFNALRHGQIGRAH